jgi:hypothetical protein
MAQNFFGHNPLKRLPYPPYSPNTCPSDFYLSGKINSVLIGREIPNNISLLQVVSVILDALSDPESQRVFQSWIEQIERVIDARGNYLTSSIFPSSPSHARSIPSWLVYLLLGILYYACLWGFYPE